MNSTNRRGFLGMLALPFCRPTPTPKRVGPPIVQASPEQAARLTAYLHALLATAEERGRLLEETDVLNAAYWSYCEDRGHPNRPGHRDNFEDEESNRLWSVYFEKHCEADAVERARLDLIIELRADVEGMLDEAGIERPSDHATLLSFTARPMAGIVAGDRTFFLVGSHWACESSMEPGTWGDSEVVIV